MVHRALDGRIELDHINCEPRALRETPELVVDGLDLDRVEWDKRGLPRALGTEVVDTVDAGLLVVDDDGVDVPAEDDGDGCFVFALRWFAEVNDSTTNAFRPKGPSATG